MENQYQKSHLCIKCGKVMWKRDADYSIYLFDDIYCRKHIPETDKNGIDTLHLSETRNKGKSVHNQHMPQMSKLVPQENRL